MANEIQEFFLGENKQEIENEKKNKGFNGVVPLFNG